jgi:PPOX class probable FMN-dependent enzyme
MPERPGNKLADSLRNILANPNVGLLFLIPGVGDTLRVNGRATLTTDVTLLEALTVEGKAPKLALLIEVDEVFTHCSKAFIRSDLWNHEQHIERDELPSQGAILRGLNPDIDAEQYDVERAERYSRREGLY